LSERGRLAASSLHIERADCRHGYVGTSAIGQRNALFGTRGSAPSAAAARKPSNGELTVRFRIILTCALVLSACSAPADGSGEPNEFSAEDLRAFYEEYETALRAHRRDTLAHFYHPQGATIVFNGERMQFTHAVLDSMYRGEWQGPLFMAFDSLHWQPISTSQGIVTGRFRWLTAEAPDTVEYVYLSVVEQTAAGPRILVEHETTLSPKEP
jgi:hypothetical protein